MDLILPLTTLILIVAGLAMQIMTRNAWQSAIAAVEDRIDRLEKRADAVEKITETSTSLAAAVAKQTAARVKYTEAALAELKHREEARRATKGGDK